MNQAEPRQWYESAVIAPRVGVRPPEFRHFRLGRSLALPDSTNSAQQERRPPGLDKFGTTGASPSRRLVKNFPPKKW